MSITIGNIIAYSGIVISALACYYVYWRKRIPFHPATFFLLLLACFGIAAGLMYSIASICLFGFNTLILNFTYSDLTIPALAGSIGGTATTTYFGIKLLMDNKKKK